MRINSVYLVLFILLLSGCGYPQERRQQLDQLQAHIRYVQSAVDLHFKERHILPYRYSEDELKLTTKYLVDFSRLSNHVFQIPPSSFEKGGNFVYVLTDVERNPKVKLFDLRVQDKVEQVQISVRSYLKRNKRLPIKEKVGPYMHVLNIHKLEMPGEIIPSPYCPGESRGFLIDRTGRVYIDYRNDVMRLIQKKQFKIGGREDLRLLLSGESLYVPAYAPVICYKEGELSVSPVPK